MTAKAMLDLIGEIALYHRNGMDFEVEIIDARNIRYGNVDVLITPVKGTGTTWVARDSVTIVKD